MQRQIWCLEYKAALRRKSERSDVIREMSKMGMLSCLLVQGNTPNNELVRLYTRWRRNSIRLLECSVGNVFFYSTSCHSRVLATGNKLDKLLVKTVPKACKHAGASHNNNVLSHG